MKNPTRSSESLTPVAGASAAVASGVNLYETAGALGVYTVSCVGPVESRRAEYVSLRDRLAALDASASTWAKAKVDELKAKLAEIPLEEKFSEVFPNTVVTVGKNDLLDKYLAGSAYTAAWYLGLIDLTGYTAIAAGDTMSSHAGWTESSAYSQANRPTAAFSAASGGSKALSSAATFSINATVTIKGAFMASNSTKGGTTGILLSAGLFSGGDKSLQNGDTLSVSWSLAV